MARLPPILEDGALHSVSLAAASTRQTKISHLAMIGWYHTPHKPNGQTGETGQFSPEWDSGLRELRTSHDSLSLEVLHPRLLLRLRGSAVRGFRERSFRIRRALCAGRRPAYPLCAGRQTPVRTRVADG